jgi:hypothetical protein
VLGHKLRAQQDRFCTVIYGNLTKRDNGFDVELASGCHLPPLQLHADGGAYYWTPLAVTPSASLQSRSANDHGTREMSLRPVSPAAMDHPAQRALASNS